MCVSVCLVPVLSDSLELELEMVVVPGPKPGPSARAASVYSLAIFPVPGLTFLWCFMLIPVLIIFSADR